MFEQFWTGSLKELEGMLRDGRLLVKGEFVISIYPTLK